MVCNPRGFSVRTEFSIIDCGEFWFLKGPRPSIAKTGANATAWAPAVDTRDETRTRMPLTARDFESLASTDSATRAELGIYTLLPHRTSSTGEGEAGRAFHRRPHAADRCAIAALAA